MYIYSCLPVGMELRGLLCHISHPMYTEVGEGWSLPASLQIWRQHKTRGHTLALVTYYIVWTLTFLCSFVIYYSQYFKIARYSIVHCFIIKGILNQTGRVIWITLVISVQNVVWSTVSASVPPGTCVTVERQRIQSLILGLYLTHVAALVGVPWNLTVDTPVCYSVTLVRYKLYF